MIQRNSIHEKYSKYIYPIKDTSYPRKADESPWNYFINKSGQQKRGIWKET